MHLSAKSYLIPEVFNWRKSLQQMRVGLTVYPDAKNETTFLPHAK